MLHQIFCCTYMLQGILLSTTCRISKTRLDQERFSFNIQHQSMRGPKIWFLHGKAKRRNYVYMYISSWIRARRDENTTRLSRESYRINFFLSSAGCSAEYSVSYSSINQIGRNGLGTTSRRWLDYFSGQSQHLRAARLGESGQPWLSGQQESPGYRHPGESLHVCCSTFRSRISSRTSRTSTELMHRLARPRISRPPDHRRRLNNFVLTDLIRCCDSINSHD